jgi:hypothetical protein
VNHATHSTDSSNGGISHEANGNTDQVGIIIGAAVWGTALAAIPDSNNIIRACYDKKDGDLRVIDFEAGERCDKNEEGTGWAPGFSSTSQMAHHSGNR